jgi:hypothetical protein
MTDRKRQAESEIPISEEYGTQPNTKRQRADDPSDLEGKDRESSNSDVEDKEREVKDRLCDPGDGKRSDAHKEPRDPEERKLEAKEDKWPMVADIIGTIASYLPPGRARIVKWRCVPTTTLVEPQITAELLASENDTEGLQHVLCYHKDLDMSAITGKAVRTKADSAFITDLIKSRDIRPDTILCAAAGGNNQEWLKWSMDNGATQFNEALVEAASGGHQSVITTLLESGKVTSFRRAIIAACKSGNTSLTTLLTRTLKMSKRTGINYEHYGIEDALCRIAAKNDDIPMLELVTNWVSSFYPLTVRSILGQAAKSGSLRVLGWMVHAGIKEFGSAYVDAAGAGSIDALKHMRTLPKARGYIGIALIAAAFKGKHNALETIWEHLAESFETKDQLATLNDEFYDAELRYGDDFESDLALDAKVIEQRPPDADRIAGVRVLLPRRRARPHTVDDVATTSPLHGLRSYLQRALMRAASAGHLITVKKLLRLGAQVHWKILHHAVAGYHMEVARHFVSEWNVEDESFKKVVEICASPDTTFVYWTALVRVAAGDLGRMGAMLQHFIDTRNADAIYLFVENLPENDWLTANGKTFVLMIYEFMNDLRMPEEVRKLCLCTSATHVIPNCYQVLKPTYTVLMHAIFLYEMSIISGICESQWWLTAGTAKKALAEIEYRIQLDDSEFPAMSDNYHEPLMIAKAKLLKYWPSAGLGQ